VLKTHVFRQYDNISRRLDACIDYQRLGNNSIPIYGIELLLFYHHHHILLLLLLLLLILFYFLNIKCLSECLIIDLKFINYIENDEKIII
jgi:hypothetical protein